MKQMCYLLFFVLINAQTAFGTTYFFEKTGSAKFYDNIGWPSENSRTRVPGRLADVVSRANGGDTIIISGGTNGVRDVEINNLPI